MYNIVKENFYLVASRLKAYKRLDLIVQAFKELKYNLKVVGRGPELERLKRIAGENTSFYTDLDDIELRQLYWKAKAFVFAGVEDFGLVNAEAQSCGLPVVAYNKGGVCEVVIDRVSGILYNEQTVEGIIEGVKAFETLEFAPIDVREVALKFDKNIFKKEFLNLI